MSVFAIKVLVVLLAAVGLFGIGIGLYTKRNEFARLRRIAGIGCVEYDKMGFAKGIYAYSHAFQDFDVEGMLSLKRLKVVQLDQTLVSLRGISLLSGIPLESLKISDRRLGDEAIPEIAKARTLTHLSIEMPRVTSGSLHVLSAIPNLRVLELACDVDAPDIDELKRLLPKCQIVAKTHPAVIRTE